MNKSISVYILKLSNDKYYIGKSCNPPERIRQHFLLKTGKWIKTHNPLYVEKIVSDCNVFDEEKITLEYMYKYGIDNVRGGSFCNVNLTEEEVKYLKRQICSINDLCYHCHSNKHFTSRCRKKKVKCFKCKKYGHYSNNCDKIKKECKKEEHKTEDKEIQIEIRKENFVKKVLNNMLDYLKDIIN